ncbi:MAG: carboxylating nicotinate-nucleotide diphosphorylase [Thermaurantimonas aggregans]|nr:carboxylating nicotinate-nucleotide diphosphorylase [Thermaurantimonas aggregans]MCX8149800.1 carboxylating nicotinate-nucleotide diphosphorylase [Thermaurantimonas aggregans]
MYFATFEEELDYFLNYTLQEDIGSGDHSSLACISSDAVGTSKLLVKEPCVLAGLEVVEAIFKKLDPNTRIHFYKVDGAACEVGEIAFEVKARIHALLSGERLMLNILQRMSGIATRTRRLADMISHTRCRLLDTRKTTPGMRFLEKRAVAIGGGYNHRFGLYDMIMLKDNHIDFAGGIEKAIKKTHQYLAEKNLSLKIEVECRNLPEVEQVLTVGGVDRIMFDNFSPSMIVKALQLVKGAFETEASGGITEQNIVEYAETGVDFISMGALTHSVKSIDLSFKAE